MSQFYKNVIPTGPFTRSKISRYTGLSDEIVAHWTREGLLIPSNNDGGGAGRHKEFDYIQVQKAAILAHMRDFGCNIDALRWLSGTIERGVLLSKMSDFYNMREIYIIGYAMRSYRRFLSGERVTVDILDKSTGYFEKFAARNLDDCLQFTLSGNGYSEKEEADRRLWLHEIIPQYHSQMDSDAVEIIADFDPQRLMDARTDSVVLIWPTASGWKLHQTSDAGNLSGLDQAPRAGIMLYITKILRELWSIEDWQLDRSYEERRIEQSIRRQLKQEQDQVNGRG